MNECVEQGHLFFGQGLSDLGSDEDADCDEDGCRDAPECGRFFFDHDLCEPVAGCEGDDDDQGEVCQCDTGPDARVGAESQMEDGLVGVLGIWCEIEVVPG